MLAATPGSAYAIQAPQGAKAASLLPSAPVKTGFVVTVRRQIATSATLTSSQNPSKKGHSVTFTATVRATGTHIIPTGTVIFRNGSRELGSGQLEATGQATLSTSSLDDGSHNITAFYQGNASFDPSTSPVLVQRVEEEKKDDGKKDHEKKDHEKKEDGKKKEEDKDDDQSTDDEDDDDEGFRDRHHDDFDHICHRFHHRNHDNDGLDGSSRHHRRLHELRRLCDKWHRRDDNVILIDKGIRRFIEGYSDQGGGHHSHWDSRHHRWVPEHREHYKPQKHYHKKQYHKPVHHFAVTG
ncbi:hypothetical protein Skr01_19410 [Sphaerisporangium krabiense]|uniref:Bacterial Ig-like domain-containing protein n=1 Tax=Sphaerisporangium krabiense TaxID=763782 RepID=A0A7W9DQM3_9ACTN|nr:Ig-like domain-containing protein [Sphaerisporangium krabiense]MBB5627697.1 hypothetical protein [Sphaerisporangium krabiense]GII61856.1 hypothetical protein Skr01_19410 [Sphaerisporangium krabiense]